MYYCRRRDASTVPFVVYRLGRVNRLRSVRGVTRCCRRRRYRSYGSKSIERSRPRQSKRTLTVGDRPIANGAHTRQPAGNREATIHSVRRDTTWYSTYSTCCVDRYFWPVSKSVRRETVDNFNRPSFIRLQIVFVRPDFLSPTPVHATPVYRR